MSRAFIEQDGKIHATHPFIDASLCGMANEGNPISGMGRDTKYEFEPAKETSKRVLTCQHCIDIVRHAKSYQARHLPP